VRQHDIDGFDFNVTFEPGEDTPFVSVHDLQQWLLELDARATTPGLPTIATRLGQLGRKALKSIKREREAASA
jgi:hypothetical protein